MSELDARLEAIVRDCPSLMSALVHARDLALPDWFVFSGAVYQRVWNALTGRPADHGVKDYDLGYFDPDLSWGAEDRIIRRVADNFPPPLDRLVEVRNQARVHLWFETRFGEPYAPLGGTAEALTRFVSPAFAVGVRLEADDTLTVAAPFGLDDVFSLRLRPNALRPSSAFGPIVQALRARWPELSTGETEREHAIGG